MQSLSAALMFPDRVNKMVTISASCVSHPYSIALRNIQRKILMSDPQWKNGFYYSSGYPYHGMKIARQLVHHFLFSLFYSIIFFVFE